jgi:hypothetical protein
MVSDFDESQFQQFAIVPWDTAACDTEPSAKVDAKLLGLQF